jgi:histidinol-phosphatase
VWGTLLALQRDGRTDAAVVSAPALGRRWWAARGEGAFAADGGGDGGAERLQVSAVARIEDAVISTGNEPGMPPGWRGLTERAWTPRGFGDFWQHCLVAEGAVELATDPTLALWDYAAVQLIVEEAGGRCTTFGGDPPSPGASFLAANDALHAVAVAALGS